MRNSVAQQQIRVKQPYRHFLYLQTSSFSPTVLLLCYWGRGGGVFCQKPGLHHSSLDLKKSARAHHSSELPENLTAYNKSWAGQSPSCSCVSLQAKTEGTVNQGHAWPWSRPSRTVTTWGGQAFIHQVKKHFVHTVNLNLNKSVFLHLPSLCDDVALSIGGTCPTR